MIATTALRLPRDVDRRAMQVNLLRAGRVAELVAEHGRVDYLAAALELRSRYDLSVGASLAAIRRALIRLDVAVDGADLVLPEDGEASACAPPS